MKDYPLCRIYHQGNVSVPFQEFLLPLTFLGYFRSVTEIFKTFPTLLSINLSYAIPKHALKISIVYFRVFSRS